MKMLQRGMYNEVCDSEIDYQEGTTPLICEVFFNFGVVLIFEVVFIFGAFYI